MLGDEPHRPDPIATEHFASDAPGSGAGLASPKSRVGSSSDPDFRDSDKIEEDDPLGTPQPAAAPAPGAADEPPRAQASAKPVPPTQFLVQRLVEAFRVGQNSSGRMEIQLDLRATAYEGMGIRMAQGPKGLEAVLMVDRYVTKDAVESRVSDLVTRLQAQGVEVSEVRVELRGSSSGSGQQGSRSQSEFSANGGEIGAVSPAGVQSRPGGADRHSSRTTSTDYTL